MRCGPVSGHSWLLIFRDVAFSTVRWRGGEGREGSGKVRGCEEGREESRAWEVWVASGGGGWV